jgi:hypothetical protein
LRKAGVTGFGVSVTPMRKQDLNEERHVVCESRDLIFLWNARLWPMHVDTTTEKQNRLGQSAMRQ